MIFLFLGTSLAHLEAELQHFKERSVFATSRFWQILTFLQNAVTRLPRPISDTSRTPPRPSSLPFLTPPFQLHSHNQPSQHSLDISLPFCSQPLYSKKSTDNNCNLLSHCQQPCSSLNLLNRWWRRDSLFSRNPRASLNLVTFKYFFNPIWVFFIPLLILLQFPEKN